MRWLACPRKAQVINMRFFGGLSGEETAEVLQVSAATVLRDWSIAKGSAVRMPRSAWGAAEAAALNEPLALRESGPGRTSAIAHPAFVPCN